MSGSGLAVQRKRERGSRRGSVAGARERRGRAREGAFAGPRKCVPLILGRTSSTNRILADAYSTPTTNPRMRITRDIPRHHIAVDTERCSVVVRARTGAAAASRDTGPAPDRRCGSRDAIAEHSAHPEPLPSAPSGEARPHKSTTAQTVKGGGWLSPRRDFFTYTKERGARSRAFRRWQTTEGEAQTRLVHTSRWAIS